MPLTQRRHTEPSPSTSQVHPNSDDGASRFAQVAESVWTVEHEAVEAVEKFRTLTWARLEEWQRDNEFIVRGYRRVQNSWLGCWHSVVAYLHNETVNIYTHLLGAAIFLFLFLHYATVAASYPSTTWADAVAVSVFLGSAVFCLSASSVYHVSLCHSKSVYSRCNLLDYSGIVVLIVGSFFPVIHYGFFCKPHLQLFYVSLILAVGAGAAYIVLSPEYSKRSHRGARTNVFVALGVSALLPVGHALLIHGLKRTREEMGLDWLVGGGAIYIVGALIYANRIPERFSPGTFDIFLASHQIFHVLVVLAALLHHHCVMKDLQHWHGTHAGACDAVSG